MDAEWKRCAWRRDEGRKAEVVFEAGKRCIGREGDRAGEEPAYDALKTWLSDSAGRALPPAIEVVAGKAMADSFAAAAAAASETSEAAGSGERN